MGRQFGGVGHGKRLEVRSLGGPALVKVDHPSTIATGYAGTLVRDGVLYFEPRLPSRLDGLSFAMQFRGTPIEVTLTGDRLTLAVHPEGASRPVRVAVRDEVRELCPGERAVFELSRDPATARPAARD
jgi:Glycosyl hydrolase family 65, C-terminal domain